MHSTRTAEQTSVTANAPVTAPQQAAYPESRGTLHKADGKQGLAFAKVASVGLVIGLSAAVGLETAGMAVTLLAVALGVAAFALWDREVKTAPEPAVSVTVTAQPIQVADIKVKNPFTLIVGEEVAAFDPSQREEMLAQARKALVDMDHSVSH